MNRKGLIGSLVVIFILLVWFFLTMNQTSKEALLFPSPFSLISAFMSNFNELLLFSLTTWYRVVIGLLMGSLLGFVFGILMSLSKTINYLFDPIIEIVRPIPPVALTPFFILWFGLGDLSQFLLISLGCFTIIVISTYESIKNVPPVYIRASKSLGANTISLYKTIIVPSIMPALLPHLRVALATSFALTVAAEYLGAQGGLGYVIRNARTILQTDMVLLSALILGLQSLISDSVIRFTFKKITSWMPKT